MTDITVFDRYNIQENTAISTIAFISDLHFDYVDKKPCVEQSEIIKHSFIKYIKEKYSRSIICILGDCYDNCYKTLDFLKELEKEHIRGFFVLGNHDYWNDGSKSYKELIHIFGEATKDHEYFRLLMTGRKYYVDNLCFIGDSGWTSFVQNGKQVELSQFMNLPEATYVKDFLPQEILTMHNNWIEFANKVLEQEKQVIILTHNPMISFAKKTMDTWWSSETRLKESKNCWKLFGHTHKSRQRKRNNISSQRGYRNKDIEMLEEYYYLDCMKQYNQEDFGILIKNKEISKMQMIDLSALADFFSPMIVKNPDTQVELIKEVKSRGFKRSSKNWFVNDKANT